LINANRFYKTYFLISLDFYWILKNKAVRSFLNSEKNVFSKSFAKIKPEMGFGEVNFINKFALAEKTNEK